MTRGGAVVARVAHNHEVGGANPPPATRSKHKLLFKNDSRSRTVVFSFTLGFDLCPIAQLRALGPQKALLLGAQKVGSSGAIPASLAQASRTPLPGDGYPVYALGNCNIRLSIV